MRKKQVVLTVLLVCGPVFVGGCPGILLLAAVGVGAAGTVAYVKGDLNAVEGKQLDTVYAATKKAVEELELKVTTDAKDQMGAQIVARDSQDKKVTIKLAATTKDTTTISIRFGAFGDETKSRLVLDKIRKKLE